MRTFEVFVFLEIEGAFMTTTHKKLGVGLAASLLGALVVLALVFSVTAQAAPQKLFGTVGPDSPSI